MKPWPQCFDDLLPYLPSSVAGVLTVAQVVLAFLVHGEPPLALEWAGWICLWTAGLLALLPILTFMRRGGVPRGKSYVQTTLLVDRGIYALVRHPQGGTAWLLINLGVMLVAWHWSSPLLGLPSMLLAYADTFKADQSCVEKFGPAYERYMERVPRVNPLAGLVRWLRRRRAG